MNNFKFTADDFQKPRTLAVFTMVLWLLERFLGLNWLVYFVLAGAIMTIFALIWSILSVWLRK